MEHHSVSTAVHPNLARKADVLLPDNPWKTMLVACADLQDRSIHAPNGPLQLPWVEIGLGYHFSGFSSGVAFGHWDLVHIAMDALPYDPRHARNQLINYFGLLNAAGMMPGTIISTAREPLEMALPIDPVVSHPPLWQEFVHDYYQLTGDADFVRHAFDFGQRNLAWWERERSAPEGGFFYMDVVKRWWESGVDAGVRWDEVDGRPHACIDATCHLQSVYRRMAEWATILGEDATPYAGRAQELHAFINAELWDAASQFFYDIEMVRGHKGRIKTYEGLWPLILGSADADKWPALVAHLMNPREFNTYHPVATVALDEPTYSNNCWRGPAWNSISFWVIRGCRLAGYRDEAAVLARKVLDATAVRYAQHGAIFEFYHSSGESMEGMSRKTEDRGPCRDYLGHNPLNAIYWMLHESGPAIGE
jgi:glycogen debranching enzyme